MALAIVLALLASSVLFGQRLPIKSFSASDGLPSGGIAQIIKDAHGFLWFCSSEGVARFDGYSFARIGAESGLPSGAIHDLLQTRDGCFWFATNGGLCRLDPSVGPKPSGVSLVQLLNASSEGTSVRCLLEDREGVLWCGTSTGLFRVDRTPGRESLQPVDLGLPRKLWDDPIISALAEREGGGLWVGAGSGLYALNPDGKVLRFTQADGLPDTMIRALAADGRGSLWVGTRQGIGRLRVAQGTRRLAFETRISAAEGLASSDIQALHLMADGRVAVGTAQGVSILAQGAIQNFGLAHGISVPVLSLAENSNGDLWLGGDNGVQRWTRDGLTTYGQNEGLSDPKVDSILEDGAGVLVAVKAQADSILFHHWRGDRFQSSTLRPGGFIPGWGWNQRLLQDHLGEWWVATAQGLLRLGPARSAAELSRGRRPRTYRVATAIGTNELFSVFEDSRGDVWFSAASPVTNGLGRWRRTEDKIQGFHEEDGLPRLFDSLPTAFAEDRGGNVWVAFNGAGVARFRKGRFERFRREQGIPEGWIRALLRDASGRLWMATAGGGVGIVEDPEADAPRVRSLTTANGLASNSVWSLAQDAWGRIYLGTAAGINRLDPHNGRVVHFTEAQGLAPGIPRAILRSRDGAMWFGLSGGLSRYQPGAPAPAGSPPIFMTGIRIGGIREFVPESGTSNWELRNLPSHQNRIQVDFTSPGRLSGEAFQYQYLLQGVSDDWSAPGPERSVDFANLAPGRYHFRVRAVGAEGTASEPPAELRFTILAPIWMRWWFLALASGSLLGLLWLGYRSRLHHLLEVERIRTRIAADLHDDIGASLSRIAILSEVVKLRTPEGQPEMAGFLGEIAESSRDLVDSMGEIVWSIDPRRDDLKHLTARIGQFASGALDARGIRWTMTLPADPARIKLNPEHRRGLFLILKEAINNALKHSGCRSVNLLVEVGGGVLAAQVRDDGAGLPPEAAGMESAAHRRGRGLANMRARAKEMGGNVTIASGAGGTTVRVELPHRSKGGA